MTLPSPNSCCEGTEHHAAILADGACCRELVDAHEQGQLLASEGMARALLHADPEWRRKAEGAIRAMARTGVPFTADDVRRIAGEPKPFNALGALFRELARQRVIVGVGTTQTRRARGRARKITIWKGRT